MLMKTAVWGSGVYAGYLAFQLGREQIDFFIDRKKDAEKSYLGRPVLYMGDIEDWSDLYVYVPDNYCSEVFPILESHGLEQGKHFESCSEKRYISRSRGDEDFARAMSELDELDNKSLSGCFAWIGRFWLSKRSDATAYKTMLFAHRKEILLVSEAIWYHSSELERMLDTKVASVPIFSEMRLHIKLEDEIAEEEILKDVQCEEERRSIEYLAEGILHNRHNGKMDRLSSLYNARMIYEYYRKLVKDRPLRFFLFDGGDVPESNVLASLCKKYRLPTLFTHAAVIPGTIHFDPGGDLGSSLPSVFPNEFRRLPVDDQDISKAQEVCSFLRQTGLNRKNQPQNDCASFIRKKLKTGRPIVFCVGQNDISCSMIPYTDESARYHSPIFRSSIASAIYLAEICNQHDWNLMYKPHPMYVIPGDEERLPANAIYVESGNINDLIDLSDVVVTITSSTNYIALIRQKPVLMLGYNQTHGQGCTYEAFDKNLIEDEMEQALEHGFTNEQKENFIQHVARLLKYYLYDDLSERELRYGLQIPQDLDHLFDLKRALEGMNHGN